MCAEQLDFFFPPAPDPASTPAPRIGVLIPCYNHARYVPRAIRSVLGQTLPAARLLVIDDGSTDDSVEVIRSLGDSRIELLTQENQNAYNTINRGVQLLASDCDFIAILNSDDFFHPERLARLLPVLTDDPNAMVACSALHLVDENDAPLPSDHPRARWFDAIWSLEPRDDLEMAEWLGLGNFPGTTSNILARASYLAANPMRPYHFNHDYAFLCVAAVRGVLRVLAEPLVGYRIHGSNTMNTGSARLMRELLRQHVDFLRDFHDEASRDPQARRRMKLYLQAAFENISAFDAGLFLHVLGHALQGGSADSLDQWILNLEETDYPELSRFPNRHHTTNWPGGGPLGTCSTLPEKLDAIRAERDASRQDAADLKSLSRSLARAADDKRHALGVLLGKAPRLLGLSGKTPREKLGSLRTLAESSSWLAALREE